MDTTSPAGKMIFPIFAALWWSLNGMSCVHGPSPVWPRHTLVGVKGVVGPHAPESSCNARQIS